MAVCLQVTVSTQLPVPAAPQHLQFLNTPTASAFDLSPTSLPASSVTIDLFKYLGLQSPLPLHFLSTPTYVAFDL